MDSAKQVDPFLRLHHGTDLASANDLLRYGIDPVRAMVYNATGEFWTTTEHALAEVFALVNPAGGSPACFEFDFPVAVLQRLLIQQPRVVYQHGDDTYEFLPGSFLELNANLTNPQIVGVP
jgi:hypothetical protein